MTEQELISSLKGLHQIKPRKNWVLLVKSQVMDAASQPAINRTFQEPVKTRGTLAAFFAFTAQRKFAYAFSAVLLLIAAAIGATQLMPQHRGANVGASKVAGSQVAALTQTPEDAAVKANFEDFKAKSQDLAKTAKLKSGDVAIAAKAVSDAAKQLTDAIQKDPASAKAIALEVNNNKTYLDIVDGSELKETSDGLYKTIDAQMIADLHKATLTDDQAKALQTIDELYAKGSYSAALENVLLLNVVVESK